jgi:hypothetical protein
MENKRNNSANKNGKLLPRLASPMLQDMSKRAFAKSISSSQNALVHQLFETLSNRRYHNDLIINQFKETFQKFKFRFDRKINSGFAKIEKAVIAFDQGTNAVAKKNFKPSHRALRNKVAKPIKSTAGNSGLRAYLSPLLAASRYVGKHKLLFGTSALLIGGSYWYRKNVMASAPELSHRDAIRQYARKSALWLQEDLLERGPVFFVYSLWWERAFMKK